MPKAAAVEHPDTRVKEISTGLVPISIIRIQSNVRKHVDKNKLAELSKNIQKVGVLEPVLLRRKDGEIVLIAGHRRLQAATDAGLKMIPGRVLDVDDATAAEIQALENLHRQDLTAVEEANAFKMLMSGAGYSVEDLAQKIDKSTAYVYRAVRLLDLPAAAIEAIDAGKITPNHGHQLLRIQGKDVQENLLKSCLREHSTARELKETIDEEVGRNLINAPFPKDEPYAGQIACAKCPFNSGNQGDLFDGVEKGRCTNPGCFDVKIGQAAKDLEVKVKQMHPGIRFLGHFKDSYGSNGYHRQVNGMTDLEQIWNDDQKKRTKQILKTNPNKFTAVIEGPNYQGKLEVKYFIGKGATPRGGSTSSSHSAMERPSRVEALKGLVDAAVRRECWVKSERLPSAKQLLDVIEDSEIDGICQILQLNIEQVEAWSAESLLKLLWFIRAGGLDRYDGNTLEKPMKIDRKAIEKRIREEAAEVWPKSQSPACQICGCTPMKACKMRKGSYRGCWWVRPGICSACKDKPAPANPKKK